MYVKKLDTKVKSIARNVRRKIERLSKKPPYYSDSKSLECMCVVASYELYKKLKELNYKNVSFVEGQYLPLVYSHDDFTNHCWVTFEEFIIDLTFTQFDIAAKKISVFHKKNKLFKPVRINAKAINCIKKDWPYDQRPCEFIPKRVFAQLCDEWHS